jgi:hypothetical protein
LQEPPIAEAEAKRFPKADNPIIAENEAFALSDPDTRAKQQKAWLMGARASIWNRRPRCRRIGCNGCVEFQARFSLCGYYQALSAPWPPGKPSP